MTAAVLCCSERVYVCMCSTTELELITTVMNLLIIINKALDKNKHERGMIALTGRGTWRHQKAAKFQIFFSLVFSVRAHNVCGLMKYNYLVHIIKSKISENEEGPTSEMYECLGKHRQPIILTFLNFSSRRNETEKQKSLDALEKSRVHRRSGVKCRVFSH